MKIVVINGSPRKDWNSAKLLDKIWALSLFYNYPELQDFLHADFVRLEADALIETYCTWIL